jgi:hypothetical protein
VPPQPPCTRHDRVARIERSFGFGDEPVNKPAAGDLISVALPNTTPPRVDGCLQIYSENSDKITGATLNDGETSGTWAKAGELLDVTGAPDGGLAVFVTEMPTAGTISGGSVNRTRPRR